VDLTRPASPIDRWALDPTIVHLNHGSFGGCPRAVLDAAASFRARLEGSPMRFFVLEINVRCLDGIDSFAVPTKPYDGRAR